MLVFLVGILQAFAGEMMVNGDGFNKLEAIWVTTLHGLINTLIKAKRLNAKFDRNGFGPSPEFSPFAWSSLDYLKQFLSSQFTLNIKAVCKPSRNIMRKIETINPPTR